MLFNLSLSKLQRQAGLSIAITLVATLSTAICANASNTAIDRVGLRNILPQNDSTQSVRTQFPHLAITVIKAPPGWLTTIPRGACWTLKARVWSNASTSRMVGPFDFCNDVDQEVNIGPAGGFAIQTPRLEDSTPDLTGKTYVTGILRTDGPRPPKTLLPEGRDIQDEQMKQGGSAGSVILLYTQTPLGVLLTNLRYGLGGDATKDDHDVRVWIVSVNKPENATSQVSPKQSPHGHPPVSVVVTNSWNDFPPAERLSQR